MQNLYLWVGLMQRIEGKVVSAAVMDRLSKEIEGLKQQGFTPGLEVVIVGNDPASEVYVRNKVLRATELRMHSAKHEMPEDTTQEDLLALII